MGDRGNIVLKGKETFPNDQRVYLYTHWGGSERHVTLARALDRNRGRWSDGSYISRNIFSELCGGDMGETGFGLSGIPTDNSYAFLVVDVDANTVCEEADKREDYNILPAKASDLEPVSFADFVARHLEKETA